ncbi:hypothetical protein BJF79_41840 [Actinomadura sp. CNU-125]|uniref:DUF4132 domain-containing protein n=1 Tax=Actinomadura sp. CNU-125 TaxID=1904961 RepID=UPI0009640E0B|nr:DUF4132 domain-containing protein [Actinomadura sp. CNU-125]OLT28245.1 hypothetical protein BJF79_41840 [Actinomadura sp. CNU-125]
MLAMSKPDAPYAGVRVVRDLCDPASAAEFGWELFERWRAVGAPPKESWALAQLAHTGDDGTVRRLAPVIRAWPGEKGHAKAVTGLDVLAGIGTETSLMHLSFIAQRVKFAALKTRAREKIDEVAFGLELTADQLADRLVPDFGLDASGTLTLDYGPRRFTVGFDERLVPFVRDESGKPRKTLPKPGAKDDPALAPAARKLFTDLKKEVRTIAADQLRRFEQAMITGRRWPLAEFRDLFVAHPLRRHLVRRLVWAADDGTDGGTDGGPAFRVAEDGTFADASDDPIVLPVTARVRVAHPFDLAGDLPAWSELFADYEILQPFPQLARPVHTLAPDERTTGRLARFVGAEVPAFAVLGLVDRGWDRGEPQDAGVEDRITRRLDDRRHVIVELEPGIPVGDPDRHGDQTLADVRFTEPPGDLDPMLASEALADLLHLTGRTR